MNKWLLLGLFGIALWIYQEDEKKQDSNKQVNTKQETVKQDAKETDSYLITDKQKQDMSKQYGQDPGYTDSKWEGDTFVLYVKSPPPKNAFYNYAKVLCGDGNNKYGIKKFKLKIMKLNTNEVTGTTTCYK